MIRPSWEISEITAILGGIEVLGDCLRTDQLADDHQVEKAMAAIPATLATVTQRLQALSRVLDGNIDPKMITTEHNEDAPSSAMDSVVRCPAWSLDEQIERLEGTLKRLKGHRDGALEESPSPGRR